METRNTNIIHGGKTMTTFKVSFGDKVFEKAFGGVWHSKNARVLRKNMEEEVYNWYECLCAKCNKIPIWKTAMNITINKIA